MERKPADFSRLSLDKLMLEHLCVKKWKLRKRFMAKTASWVAGYQRDLEGEIERRLAVERRGREEAETEDPG